MRMCTRQSLLRYKPNSIAFFVIVFSLCDTVYMLCGAIPDVVGSIDATSTVFGASDLNIADVHIGKDIVFVLTK